MDFPGPLAPKGVDCKAARIAQPRRAKESPMAFARFLAAALLVILTACATAPAPQAPHPNYYVMRHLQKAAGQDPGLPSKGQANAARLAGLLAGDPPSAIYVSTTRRARETAAPLAARLGLMTR